MGLWIAGLVGLLIPASLFGFISLIGTALLIGEFGVGGLSSSDMLQMVEYAIPAMLGIAGTVWLVNGRERFLRQRHRDQRLMVLGFWLLAIGLVAGTIYIDNYLM